jgi:hypothetical protein
MRDQKPVRSVGRPLAIERPSAAALSALDLTGLTALVRVVR